MWNEEEQDCLAEMAENADNGECHAGEVAEGVTDEDLRWVSKIERELLQSIVQVHQLHLQLTC